MRYDDKRADAIYSPERSDGGRDWPTIIGAFVIAALLIIGVAAWLF